jgi:transcription-repair coupling factor (superfamily II helicase)
MRDTAGKAMLVIEQIKSVDAAIELLSRLADQQIKSAKEILSR